MSQAPSRAEADRPRKKRNREKLVVEFDEEARKNFLTGFQRRKQERRKRALEIMEKKARDERIAARKEIRDRIVAEKREAAKAMLEMEAAGHVSEDEDASTRVVEAMAGKNEKVDQFVDDFTEHAFGSALVTVTTTVPDDEAEEVAPNPLKTAIDNEINNIRLPKHTKIAQSELSRKANSLRDKLTGKNKKHGKSAKHKAHGKKRK